MKDLKLQKGKHFKCLECGGKIRGYASHYINKMGQPLKCVYCINKIRRPRALKVDWKKARGISLVKN